MTQNQLQMAAEDLRQSKALRLPAAIFSGSYRHQSAVPTLRQSTIFPTSPGGSPLFSNMQASLGLLDTYDAHVTVNQPLFTGGRLRLGQTIAQETILSRQVELAKNRSELIYKIETAYAGVLKAGKFLAIARSGYTQVQAHLRDVDNLFTQGVVRNDEKLKGQVKLSEAELTVQRAENALMLSRAHLENILSAPLNSADSLADFKSDPIDPLDLETSLAQALAARPEMEIVSHLAAAAQSSRKWARGNLWPSIAAFGTAGYGKPGLDYLNKEWMEYWLAGVGIDWKLWDWGHIRSQIQQSQIRIESVSALDRQTENAIKLDVTDAYFRCRDAQQSVLVLQKTLSQAAESYRIAEHLYRQGQSTHTDYFDAQSIYQNIERQLVQAEIDLALAYSNLRRARGQNLDYYHLPVKDIEK
jgi:outer membrane protein TolC